MGTEPEWQNLIPEVYEELHRLAARYMRYERPDHTLQATALLNEAFLRLVDRTRISVNDRPHFVRLAARIMRQVLVDHARARLADKRGAGLRATMPDQIASPQASVDVLALDRALERLAELDAQQARLVELRFFGGLTVPEAAAALGCSPRTVDREWRLARAWIRQQLEQER